MFNVHSNFWRTLHFHTKACIAAKQSCSLSQMTPWGEENILRVKVHSGSIITIYIRKPSMSASLAWPSQATRGRILNFVWEAYLNITNATSVSLITSLKPRIYANYLLKPLLRACLFQLTPTFYGLATLHIIHIEPELGPPDSTETPQNNELQNSAGQKEALETLYNGDDVVLQLQWRTERHSMIHKNLIDTKLHNKVSICTTRF